MRMIVIHNKGNDKGDVYAINTDTIRCIEYLGYTEQIQIHTLDNTYFKIGPGDCDPILQQPFFLYESDRVSGEIREFATKNVYVVFELYNEILNFCQYSNKMRLTIET